MHPRTLPLAALAVVVAALGAGCGGNSSSGSESEAASTGASTSGNAESSGAAKTITISETEYKLTPSSVSLPSAGTYTIRVVNKGSVTHALEVEGNGVEEESGDVGAGDTKTFTVDFKGSGKYEMYCPVDGHRQQGMEGDITIGTSGAGPAGTTTDTSTTETETHTDTGGGNSGPGGGY